MITQPTKIEAPELSVTQWFNSEKSLTLDDFKGRVLVIEAFQMLCPGCVLHGLPQAQKIDALYPKERVSVIGLHSVFEHHAAMTDVSLAAFIHEYRLTFPIGVDEPGKGAIPKTMETYQLRGTPSLVIIDQEGHLRANHFGQVSDMQIGAEIATLLAEAPLQDMNFAESEVSADGCDDGGCPLPTNC